MNKPATDWSELVKELQGDRRNGDRLNLSFSIEIRGTDSSGALFGEKTKTLDISESGCRFETKLPLVPGDIIAIKLAGPNDSLQNREPQLFEIVWSTPTPSGRSVGARKSRDAKLWRVTFPPSKSSAKSTKE